MDVIEIVARKKEATGKKANAQTRKTGWVPGIIYGGKENVMFEVEEKAFNKAIFTPKIYVINLNVEGKVYKTVIQDMQYHPVTDYIVHIDLLEVADDKKVSIKLPINLTGNSEGVKQGGKLISKMRKLKVSGFIKDMPETLDIDISGLGLSQSIKVETIKFPNLEILDSKSALICTVKATRSSAKQEAAPTGKKK